MKKVKLFMALALLAFFGLLIYTNYISPSLCTEESNGPVKMIEIKTE